MTMFFLRGTVFKAMQPQMRLLEIASGKTTPRNDKKTLAQLGRE
jgi:hypothetical protein